MEPHHPRANDGSVPALRYDAILFDFDGVLVDSEPLHWQCWREVLAPAGFDLTWEYYAAHCIGIKDDDMVRFVEARRFPALLEAKRELLRRRAESAGLVTREVREMLRGLQLPLALVTSSSRLEVEPVLLAGEIYSCFAAFVYRESVAHLKPHPEPYRTAAALLGARTPLVVEDSGPGEESARAAGFDCLRVAEPSRVPQLLQVRLVSTSPFSV